MKTLRGMQIILNLYQIILYFRLYFEVQSGLKTKQNKTPSHLHCYRQCEAHRRRTAPGCPLLVPAPLQQLFAAKTTLQRASRLP